MERNSKVIAIVALCIGVVGLSLGFAAFSAQLTIESGATVTKTDSDYTVNLGNQEFDVVSFIAFPIIIYYAMGLNAWYFIPLYVLYAICGVCRLAYFNISLEEENKDVAIKYYKGLPVTFVSLILPVMYLISYFVPVVLHTLYFALVLFLISGLYILNFKLRKPTLKVYPFFVLLAIIVLILFLGVL